MIQTLVVNVFWLIKDMFLFLQREITQIGRKNDLVSESGESRASIRGEDILRQSVQRRECLLILVLTVNGGK